MENKILKVLFVCHGNMHRSPMAQGIFQKLIDDNNLKEKLFCDSAGTSCKNIGKPPHYKTIETLSSHGIEIKHESRIFKSSDLDNFNYVFAMDKFNLKDILFIQRISKKSDKNIFLMRHFDPVGIDLDVPDPHMGLTGFEEVYEILFRSINNFFDFLKKNVIN